MKSNGLAYSYIRFSRASQGQESKDSLRRQLNRTREFCRQHDLKLVEEMKALGVSGFKGKNVDAGSVLGAFLQKVKEGKIERGSTLVVENFDRISRDKILRCQNILSDLLCNGIAVAPLSFNGQILTEEAVNDNPSLLILAIVESMRGGSESQRKSEMIQAKFLEKKEAIKRGEKVYFGGCMPGYVAGVKGNSWILNEGRIATVKGIYADYLKGMSLGGIAAKLNAKNTPGTKHHNPVTWRSHSVRAILKNVAVTGVFQMKGLDPVESYLPVIISQADFDKVQARLALNHNRKGGSAENVNNLFAELTACKACGRKVSARQSTSPKKIYHYYVCSGHEVNVCKCNGKIRVDDVESVFFQGMAKKTPSDFLAENDKTTALEIEARKARDLALDREIEEMLGYKKAGVELEAVTRKLLAAQAAKKDIAAQIKELSAKVTTSASLPKSVHEFLGLMKKDLSNQETRRQIRNLMPSLVSKVEFDLGKKPTFQIELVNGTSWLVPADELRKALRKWPKGFDPFLVDGKGLEIVDGRDRKRLAQMLTPRPGIKISITPALGFFDK